MSDTGKVLLIGFVAIVIVLVANLYGAHASSVVQRIVTHHCLAEDNWGHITLRDYGLHKIVLKCLTKGY